MAASWQKIVSSEPALGYWAQHVACRDAVNAGETSCGTTEGVEAITGKQVTSSEVPYTPTNLFAPAGFIATKAEREVEAQWVEHRAQHDVAKSGVGGH